MEENRYDHWKRIIDQGSFFPCKIPPSCMIFVFMRKFFFLLKISSQNLGRRKKLHEIFVKKKKNKKTTRFASSITLVYSMMYISKSEHACATCIIHKVRLAHVGFQNFLVNKKTEDILHKFGIFVMQLLHF